MSGIGGVGYGQIASGIVGLMQARQNMDMARAGQEAARAYRTESLENSRALARAAQTQSELALDQWNRYLEDFAPVERAALEQTRRDLLRDAAVKDAQAGEFRRDLGLYRPLKEASVRSAMQGLERFGALEEALASEALRGVSPQERLAASRAAADVRQSFARAREAESRKRTALGLGPVRLAHHAQASLLAEAAAEAAARTRAAEGERDRAADETWTRRMQAMGLQSLRPGTMAPAGYRAAQAGPLADPLERARGLSGASSSAHSELAGRFGSMADQAGARELLGRQQAMTGYADFLDSFDQWTDAWSNGRNA